MALARPAVRGHCLTPTQHPSFPETRGGAWKNAITPQVSCPERESRGLGPRLPDPVPRPTEQRCHVSPWEGGGWWASPNANISAQCWKQTVLF